MRRIGLQSQQWGRKKASALAVSGLAENGAETLAPHALKLADGLLTEVRGDRARPNDWNARPYNLDLKLRIASLMLSMAGPET